MSARWYVLHVYSGFEDKVAETIREKSGQKGIENRIEEILVPKQEAVELKRGQRVSVEHKVFPGYVLAKIDMSDDVWHMIKNTPKVTGFLGGGNRPVPISDKEAARLMTRIQEGIDKPMSTVSFEIGEKVKVMEGPFATFEGMVEEIDDAKKRVKVSVSIFGRATPVELEFSQVEKLQ